MNILADPPRARAAGVPAADRRRAGPGQAPAPATIPSSPAGRPGWRARLRPVWPWLALWPWSAVWCGWHAQAAGQSWHYFAYGGRLIFTAGPGGGLRLYAAHPQLQIGPLTLIVAGVLERLAQNQALAILAMSVTGPPLLAAVWRLLPPPERRRRGRLLLAGLVFLPVWAEVTTHFAHLDDLLALGFTILALHAVAGRRPVWAGLALAAATDAKPWAAAFVALLLALPRRQRWTALGVFAGGVAAAWLPFLLADPHTLSAARYTIPNDPTSSLRALGVTAARTPWWDRPAQLALGVAGGCLAVWRGRWQAVMLVAISARMLLDPGVYPYYTSGALLATVVVDLAGTRWRLPWASIAAAVMLYVSRFSELVPMTLHQLGVLRVVFTVGAPTLILAVPGWWLIRRPGRHASAAVRWRSTPSRAGRSSSPGAGARDGRVLPPTRPARAASAR